MFINDKGSRSNQAKIVNHLVLEQGISDKIKISGKNYWLWYNKPMIRKIEIKTGQTDPLEKGGTVR